MSEIDLHFLSRKGYGIMVIWEKITSKSMITGTIIKTKLKIIISIKDWVVIFACSSIKAGAGIAQSV
jgi:hypothetical protein